MTTLSVVSEPVSIGRIYLRGGCAGYHAHTNNGLVSIGMGYQSVNMSWHCDELNFKAEATFGISGPLTNKHVPHLVTRFFHNVKMCNAFRNDACDGVDVNFTADNFQYILTHGDEDVATINNHNVPSGITIVYY
jgi:hypothetical protein